ncbi:hypothetical protein D5086_012140 [Populus alba]|uniref:Uncharacterized protein n=1 Tax=Populus alba TaxID=43335 RepID=A0ACC4C2S0_POPAL
MAPKRSSTIQIGNCEVAVEANKFVINDSEPNILHIAINRNANFKISVKFEDDYAFFVVNSKDKDSNSKCYLEEVLKIYTRELPAMNYAANTGKQSMFLEKCISKGKYCTLLLKSKSTEGPGKVIAAITYQIIPADMQYAEVPIAAVSAVYQHKGFGHFLYMELRKRLQNVGVHTIYCWGDKGSEGFWVKQGFASIAEVDKKGRPRRLPIKPNIRRALCFPGSSTLMVSYLNEGNSATPEASLQFCFPLKPRNNSSSAVYRSAESGFIAEDYTTLKSQNQITSRIENSQHERFAKDEFSGADANPSGLPQSPDCGDLAPSERGECSKMTTAAELAKTRADADVKCNYSYIQGTKRRAWEASLSSLKTKKVKGSHQTDYESDSGCGSDSERFTTNPCFRGCSLGISKNNSFGKATSMDPLTRNCMENNVKEDKSSNRTSEVLVSKEFQSKGECFRIMLMNIADDDKKTHLTKVIETLGGAVTPYGSVSTHVVTGKVRTTLNFCTALSSGAWIVSSKWLKESFRRGRFVDELPYILYDEDYVLKHKAELKDAVLRARARPQALLKGYNVCIAKHVQPPFQTLSAIVESAGGNVISGLDKENEASETIFVASEEDIEEALSAAKKGMRTFSSDWLMNCIMRQELDLEAQQFAESLYIPGHFIPVSRAKKMAAEPVFVSGATAIPSKFQSFTRNINDKSQAKLLLCSRVRASQKHSMDDRNNVYKQLGLFSLKKNIEDTVLRAEMLAPTALEHEEARRIKQEEMIHECNLWEDPAKSNEILIKLAGSAKAIDALKDLKYKAEEAKLISQLVEMEAINYRLFKQAYTASLDVRKLLDQYEMSRLLKGPYDKQGACVVIRAGSKGLNHEIWREELLNMYVKWAEKLGYKGRLVEKHTSMHGGIESVTIEFEFECAYGYLSGERGIHHKINSQNGSVHHEVTTACVDVVPLFLGTGFDFQIDDKELIVSCSPSLLRDGKSRTELTVCLQHIPTGISVQSSGERSLFANKVKAHNRLKAKLLVIAEEQKVCDVSSIRRADIVDVWQKETRSSVLQ